MKDKKEYEPTPSVMPVHGEAADALDQINKYGTYEVQDTTDTDNVFPLIGPLGAGISGITLPPDISFHPVKKDNEHQK